MSAPLMTNSRSGQKLSRAACDLCRLRKVQCNFTGASDRRCKRCGAAGVDCTFLRGHRPRGRISRHVTAARGRQSAPVDLPNGPGIPPGIPPGIISGITPPHTPSHSDSLVPNLGITHLCSLPCMKLILTDFRDYLYPILPCVHLPTLMSVVGVQDDTQTEPQTPLWTDEPHNRPLFRTVMAVAAATVASIPRRFAAYNPQGEYPTVQAMVDRALRLVIVSRVISPTYLDDDRNVEVCVTALLLAMGLHYSGRQDIARNLTNESIVLFRSMRLYRQEAHEALSDFDSEIAKRLFWHLYINQIHDHLDSVLPHHPFCFEHLDTDWEFLIPRHDESLFYAGLPPDPKYLNVGDSGSGSGNYDTSRDGCTVQPLARSRPIVSGFYALLRVYLCVIDVFSVDFPRPPPAALTALPLSMEPQFITWLPSSSSSGRPTTARPGLTLASMTRLIGRVRTIMDGLPPELQVRSEMTDRTDTLQSMSRSTMQRLIIAANIQMTSLLVQSITLETYAVQVERQRAYHGGNDGEGDSEAEATIWKLREQLAAETLKTLQQFPQEALEANGASLFARKIAATLLERDETSPLSQATTARMDAYLEQFAHTLASLDHVKPSRYLKAQTVATVTTAAALRVRQMH